MVTITNSERRSHQRYKASCLSVVLKTSRPLIRAENDGSFVILDFNRFGMAVQGVQNYKIGDQVSVVMPGAPNKTLELNGVVCNRAKIAGAYRMGLHFPDQGECELVIRKSLIDLEQSLKDALEQDV
jgi:PilZ domain